MYSCVFLAILCGIPLFIFWYHNEDSRKVERFLFEKDPQKYEILQIALFVLLVTFSLNARYIGMELFKAILNRVFK